MRKYFSFSVIAIYFLLIASDGKAGHHDLTADSLSITGRWDISITNEGKSFPAWLEVTRSGTRTLVGLFTGPSGSARPISQVNFSNGKLSFSIPPQWENGKDNLNLEATLQGDSLAGTIIFPNGRKNNFTATRAPSLKRDAAVPWGKPIKLFNGVDLKGWHPSGQTNQWVVENGILKSPKSGSNLISDAVFADFKLHLEFRFPAKSNSGVYLRGRYEVQIADDEEDYPLSSQIGAIYGFLSPVENAAKKPGEWQTFDITISGRLVTVVLNGKTIICNREIPGITGRALDSREGEPDPLMLQGDHGPVEYRNIIITPGK
jgi:hypothetical protein